MGESRNCVKLILYALVLWSLLFYLMWLCLHPKQPNYTILESHVTVATKNGSANSTGIGGGIGTILFDLEVENPNKEFGIFHDTTLLRFYSGQHIIGEKTIPSFYQKKHRTNQIHDRVDLRRQRMKLLASFSNASAKLNVDLVTEIRYHVLVFTTKRRGINLNGHVQIGPDGKISGNEKKIKLAASYSC